MKKFVLALAFAIMTVTEHSFKRFSTHQTFVQLAETAVAVKTLPELSTNQGKCEMCTMSNKSIIFVIFQNVD